jgi:hypothetical protein
MPILIHFSCLDVVIAKHHHLSHDAIALVRRRAWWRRVSSAICRLRLLKFDTVLLTVVVLIFSATVVTVVGLGLRSVGWCGCSVVVCAVVVVGLCGVLTRTSGPACAIEGLTTSFATATCCETT